MKINLLFATIICLMLIVNAGFSQEASVNFIGTQWENYFRK